MTEREIRTEKRLKLVWAHPSLCRFLIVFGKVCQYSVAVYFLTHLVLQMCFMHHFRALIIALSAAFGFVFVTVMRKVITAPRPYEVMKFCDTPPREKRGESFPSRHAYSAVVIAVLSASLTPWCLIGTVPVAIYICVSRAVLGIHFPRDVIVGALFGILFGVFGLVISYFL